MNPLAIASLVLLVVLTAFLALAAGVHYVSRLDHAERRVETSSRRVRETTALVVETLPVILGRVDRFASPDPHALEDAKNARESVLLAADADAALAAHARYLEALARVRATAATNPALRADATLAHAFRDAEARARHVTRVAERHACATRALANARATWPTRLVARWRGTGRARPRPVTVDGVRRPV